jgi:hypothetical protein
MERGRGRPPLEQEKIIAIRNAGYRKNKNGTKPTLREIADEVEVSVGSVRKYLRKGLLLLEKETPIKSETPNTANKPVVTRQIYNNADKPTTDTASNTETSEPKMDWKKKLAKLIPKPSPNPTVEQITIKEMSQFDN